MLSSTVGSKIDIVPGGRADVADARVACVADGWPDLAVRAERSKALSARVVMRYPRGSSEPRDRFSCIADTFYNERHDHRMHVLPIGEIVVITW